GPGQDGPAVGRRLGGTTPPVVTSRVARGGRLLRRGPAAAPGEPRADRPVVGPGPGRGVLPPRGGTCLGPRRLLRGRPLAGLGRQVRPPGGRPVGPDGG